MKLAMKRVELIIDYEQNTMSILFILPLYTGKLVATEKKTTNTDPTGQRRPY